MKMSKGLIFVCLQFSLITFLIFENGWFSLNSIEIMLHLLGITLGLWAIMVMRSSKLNIFPELRKESRLVAEGPYKEIRHPMYAAVLVYFLPFAINSYPSALAYLGLLVTLILKLNYEEKLLLEAFPHYATYRQKTHRLLPFIY